MKEKIARIYPFVAISLALLWLGLYLLLPLRSIESSGDFQAIAIVAVELLFFAIGFAGIVLCYKRVMIYELPASLLAAPFLHLLGVLSEEPYNHLVHLSAVGLIIAAATAFLILR